MTARQDPMLAAADLIAGLPGIAASVSPAAVATCGRVDAHPGGANVVPDLVSVTLDFRDPDAATAALSARISAVAAGGPRARHRRLAPRRAIVDRCRSTRRAGS